MLDDIRVVEGLAQALDRDDFNAAARFLSDNCVYDSPGGLVIGRDAIVDALSRRIGLDPSGL